MKKRICLLIIGYILSIILIYRINIKTNSDMEDIPMYYRQYIEDKVETINAYDRKEDNVAQFLFITDVHYNDYYQAFHAKSLMNYICNHTQIRDVFNGGDVASGKYKDHLSHDDYIRDMKAGFDYCHPDSLKDINAFFIAGNHDLGMDWDGKGGEKGRIIDVEELYQLSGLEAYKGLIKQEPDNLLNYTYTNDIEKIYYIVGTLHLSNTVVDRDNGDTYKWICNMLKECPDDYTIILFNHIVINSHADGLRPMIVLLSDAIDAYNTRTVSPKYEEREDTVIDFSNAKGTVACIIGGHAHSDWSSTTTGGTPIIVTTTDNYGGESIIDGIADRRTKADRTINEQAFDVFSIDKSTRTIYATRIGAGDDREFHY